MLNPSRQAIVVLILLTLLALTGCSKNPTDNELEMSRGKGETMCITILGTSPNGPGLIAVNALAECINKSYPGSVVTVVPGNFGTNITRINNNEADACMTDTYMALAALAGDSPYAEKLDNLAAVTYLMPTVYQIVVNGNTGLLTFDDFVDRKMKLRISTGMTGSAAVQFMQQLLAVYDLTIEDLSDWGCEIVYQNIDNSAQMLADNRIDMMVAGVIVPTPTIQELSQNKKINLLTLKPEVIKELCGQQRYYSYTIAAGTYGFLKKDLHTVNTNTIVAVPKNSPDEDVYKMTGSFHENLDYLRVAHASMADITSEKMIENLGIDLHPGAEKYYREVNILK